jgi:hypothetical protein
VKILVTAGTVYGPLDANKLVGNRIRGIWATRFACWLFARGHSIHLLLPDTFDKDRLQKELREMPFPSTPQLVANFKSPPTFDIHYHDGYNTYAALCYELAPSVDAAILAAAVVNWIPETPFKGKMPTEGFEEGAILNIPFILAPRVIDRMKKLNPGLTLIGCKMTADADKLTTIRAAYQTLLKARCNVVVGNDLSRLKLKLLVYPDGNAEGMEDFSRFYHELEAVLLDKHYRTEVTEVSAADVAATRDACQRFDALVEKYRTRFVKRIDGGDRVFGAVAVRIDADHLLVSPREKGAMFSSREAVVVTHADAQKRQVFTMQGQKATLNAPLLLRVMRQYRASAVVHLHEQNALWPELPYAPPGTQRDNDRTFETPAFNIAGHGCIFTEA